MPLKCSTSDRIALIDTSLGLEIETHTNRLSMVKAVMDNGALGGGGCYGDDHHIAALNEIEYHLEKVRANIARQRADEALEDHTDEA